jgi:hypothetical protein
MATLYRGFDIQVNGRSARRLIVAVDACGQLLAASNMSNAEGKSSLDDLQDASKNIAHAKLRGNSGGGKHLAQVVSHWAGAPPKEDKFKCGGGERLFCTTHVTRPTQIHLCTACWIANLSRPCSSQGTARRPEAFCTSRQDFA